MSSLKDSMPRLVIDIATGSNANATHLSRQHIRDIVTIEIHRGDDTIVLRLQQSVLQESITDAVFHHQATGLQCIAVLALCQLVSPFLESAFGELHDIALVNQCH